MAPIPSAKLPEGTDFRRGVFAGKLPYRSIALTLLHAVFCSGGRDMLKP